MLMLALDTASAAVSVALHDGDRVLVARSCAEPSRHAEMLMPLVAECLAEIGGGPRDLTEIAVGVGPGPFTGLRVGLVTARTLGFVLGVPVLGVCSLDALAASVIAASAVVTPGAAEFVVATDARRREVYWARYAWDGVRHERLEGPAVSLPSEVSLGAGVPVCGRGALLYPEVLGGVRAPAGEPLPDPTGAGVAELVAALLRGGGSLDVPLLPPDPLYLRRPDATPSATRKPVTA